MFTGPIERARHRIPTFPVLIVLLILFLAGCTSDRRSTKPGEPDPSIAFSEVTGPAGLKGFEHDNGATGDKWMPETLGAGCAFIDYDGDGWLDVILVDESTWRSEGDSGGALAMYRNNGDGTFTEVTAEVGLADVTAYGFGITVADYDNDGDQDFFFTTLHRNKLFRNDGGAFTEVSKQAGVAGPSEWSTAATFLDADRDGFLDLYVGNYVAWSEENDKYCTLPGVDGKVYCPPEQYEGVPPRFYHNNGDGTFTEQTKKAGFVDSPGKTLGVAIWDFNGDGWPDLVAANDAVRNTYYENDGDGTFTEKGQISGVAYNENGQPRGGMGIDIGDVDNDGRATVFIGNFSRQMVGVFRQMSPQSSLFQDRAAASRIGHASLPTLTFGLLLADFNLDRQLELFIANGHLQPERTRIQDGVEYRQPPQLFLYEGNGRFREHKGEGVFEQRMLARGAAYGDFDRDGDQDILMTENNGPAHLWRNDRTSGNYLRVHLEGTESNRDAIGTKVTAVTDSVRMSRMVRTGASYLSSSEMTLTFGLSGMSQVDTLTINWSSGKRDIRTNLSANQQLQITE